MEKGEGLLALGVWPEPVSLQSTKSRLPAKAGIPLPLPKQGEAVRERAPRLRGRAKGWSDDRGAVPRRIRRANLQIATGAVILVDDGTLL